MTNQNCWNCSQMLCGKVYTATNGDGCPYWIERKEDILEDIKTGLEIDIQAFINRGWIKKTAFTRMKFGRIKRRKHNYIPFYFIR